MNKPFNKEKLDRDFWQKIYKLPKSAGCAVISAAFKLYVLLNAPQVPAWAKVSIVVTIAYFLSPFDAIPDFLPGGYIDDMGAMTLLLGQLDVFMDTTTLGRAEQLLPKYCRKSNFGLTP